MNLKKIITNTLAVVGAVVIIDKVVDMVKTKGTECACDYLNDEEATYDSSDPCNCQCTESDESEMDFKCDNDCCCNEEISTFPEVKKYDNDESQTFEYSIKAENITSNSKEV